MINGLNKEIKRYKFKDVFERITTRNDSGNSNILTISAQHGLINQEKFFKKTVASRDLSGYYYLKNNDFAYNRSYSKEYPMGAVKRLINYSDGVVSPLYVCFRLKSKDISIKFMEYYFESGIMNKELYRITQEGARNHGVLNITVSEFFKDINLFLPSYEVQKKCVSILNQSSLVIEKQQQLIERKKEYRKGLRKKLLSAEVRFKGFTDKWIEREIGDYIIEYKEKTTVNNQYPLLTSSRNGLMLQTDYFKDKQRRTIDNIGYNIIPINYVTFRTRSDDGRFVFNQNKIIDKGIVSFFYPVFRIKEDVNSYFMITWLNNCLDRQIKREITGTSQLVLSFNKLKKLKIKLPSIEEQKKIAEVLSRADREIELLEKELLVLKLQKKGLMQKLLMYK